MSRIKSGGVKFTWSIAWVNNERDLYKWVKGRLLTVKPSVLEKEYEHWELSAKIEKYVEPKVDTIRQPITFAMLSTGKIWNGKPLLIISFLLLKTAA